MSPSGTDEWIVGMSLIGIVDVDELAILALSFASLVDPGGREQMMRKVSHSLNAL